MADDTMKHDDLQRNMGAGDKGQNPVQQSPGKTGNDIPGQKQAGQHGDQQGGQKGSRNIEDDEDDFGAGKARTQNRGGEDR